MLTGMDNLLITGGAGFIGSCYALQWLASGGRRLTVLDKLTYAGNRQSLAPLESHPGFRLVQGDIADRQLVQELLAQDRPAAIVHFAAESHVDRSIDAPQRFVQTNVVGTHQLLAAALDYWRQLPAADRQGFRFLHVSTDEVYGSLGATGKFSESSPYAPNSPYAASKAAADHLVRAYHQTYGLPTLVAHGSNTYGPRQQPDKFVPLMILNAWERHPLPVYGDGLQIRDWLHVEDHCRALGLLLAQGRPGQVYGIGGGRELTNLQVVRTICDLVERLQPELPAGTCRSLVKLVEDRPGHDRRYAVDSSKIQQQLGWRPQREFAQGLEQTVRWYRENPQWIARSVARIEFRQRLGLPLEPGAQPPVP